MEIKKDMKDEDVGGSIVGDDLAFKFVSQVGFDGEEATHCEFISSAGVHSRPTLPPYNQIKSKGFRKWIGSYIWVHLVWVFLNSIDNGP